MVVTFCFIMCGYMKHISLYPYNDSHSIFKMYSAINFLPSASYSPIQHREPVDCERGLEVLSHDAHILINDTVFA